MILMAMVLKHASSSLDKLCAVPRCESSRERTHDGQSKEADHVRLFATMHPSELAQKKKKKPDLALTLGSHLSPLPPTTLKWPTHTTCFDLYISTGCRNLNIHTHVALATLPVFSYKEAEKQNWAKLIRECVWIYTRFFFKSILNLEQ